jgi:hypothetical protein
VGDGAGAVKTSPLITSTNAGELGPTLDGRIDLAKFQQGAILSENFLHLVPGPGRRRGGTRFIEEIKDSTDRSWMVEFEFSATQAFALEFGDGYIRFYTKVGDERGRVLVSGVAAYDALTAYVPGDLASNGGTNYYCIASTTGNAPPNATYWHPLTGNIYEIPSPYTVDQLTNSDGTCALTAQQSADVLYIAHSFRDRRPRKLTRYGGTRWVLDLHLPNDGPFGPLNGDATTIYASGNTGSVTIEASAAIFAATDIDRLVRLEMENFPDPWETNKSYSINDLVRSDGKTYKALTAATSGTVTPIHDHGQSKDGDSGVNWEYQDAGYGIAKITAFTDSQTVTATVIEDRDIGLKVMPAGVVGSGNPTTRWNLGAWSQTTEYPGSVSFYKGRIFWATRTGIFGSVPNDFDSHAEDFFNEVRDDSAINYPVAGQDVSEILWIEGGEKLIVGTGGGELVAGEQNPNNPLSPFNFQAVRQSTRRARGVQPVGAGTALLYVQRSGRKLLSMDYAIERDRYVSSDQTVLNDRITRSGIIAMCYQGEPDSMLWCVRADGKLVGFTLDAEQNVAGWGRHPIGGSGFVEDAISLPSPDGSREDLWLIVRRTINGQTKRYIEVMERPWEGADKDGTPGDDQADAFYVDCGLTYRGAPATVISGLGHLEGETVHVLADGAVVSPNPVVTAGQITLTRSASVVHVGLPFNSRWVSTRIEVQSSEGTSQGKVKRPDGCAVRFVDTLGGRVGQYGGVLENISFRHVSTPMGQPEPIRDSETVDVRIEGEYNADVHVEVRQDQPLPMTITGVAPRVFIGGPR